MSLRPQFLVLLPFAVLLGGCGGSKHQTISAPVTEATTTSSGGASTTTTSSDGSSAPQTATSSSGSASGSQSSGAGATNIRVPAKFVIRPGGKLDPPTISSPAFLAVQLTFSAGDGRAHRVLVKTPTPHVLAVSAHNPRSILIPGLRAGRYAIDVDGASGGALTIGGEPGP